MGEHDVKANEPKELRAFMQAVLDDLVALERMIERGLVERDVRRIGAEQELFLVDDGWQATPKSEIILGQLEGNYSPELARFNLEANLSPLPLEGRCLSLMEEELQDLIRRARVVAQANDARLLMCGILPTLHLSDLTLDNMVGSPRFHAMNRVMRELRGGDFETLIKGLDELRVTHENVMLEACTTSFQVHFQVGDDEFAKLYNLAQVVTGPVMAAAVNSPVLLQHRLWHETRVALFQQSLDVRNKTQVARGTRQRVHFGDGWVRGSVLELLRQDVSRFRLLLSTNLGEPSTVLLERGEIPKLKALSLHNGTVYRWNRPCYGISEGRPHLRIENRVMPAGPTIPDQIANAAFYFGLMVALGDEHQDITKVMDFDDARGNFFAAARYGLSAQFRWIKGRETTARDLILSNLLPAARDGLKARGLDAGDVNRYLGIFEERVASGRTGSQWALDSLAKMGKRGTADERHRALTSAMYARQTAGLPVHSWTLADLDEISDWRHSFRTVSQIMTRDVFTVHPEDVIDLAASLMDWEHIRYVPVEDDAGHLVGLLSQRALLRVLARRQTGKAEGIAVREVMYPNPITIVPGETTLGAIAKMREHKIGCLPVVDQGRLVGIVTEHDFVEASAKLLEETLRTTHR